jgi:hypothetical protein
MYALLIPTMHKMSHFNNLEFINIGNFMFMVMVEGTFKGVWGGGGGEDANGERFLFFNYPTKIT